MHWLVAVAVVIVLLVLGFILFIFMPKPIVFFDVLIDETKLFNDSHDEIVKEIKDADLKDSVIPIYYDGRIYTDKYPIIYELLCCIPDIKMAGIINIKPKFEQKKEYGLSKLANNTVRYFYTVKHSATLRSGIWIDGAQKFFYNKEWIVGDMSREHSLFNKNRKEYTTVIFIDVQRPSSIHPGCSPTHTSSDDEIAKAFGL